MSNNNIKEIYNEKNSKLIEDFIHYINKLKYHRVIELPIEWEFKERKSLNTIKSFFVTKKVFLTTVTNPNINPMRDPTYTKIENTTVTSRNIVIDLIQKPFEVSEDQEREHRIQWDWNLWADPIFIDRREHYELQGDKYIIDYDIDVIVKKIDAIKN